MRSGTRAHTGHLAYTHEPVKVVATMRAAIRPTAVQRAKHPLLVTVEHPHLPPPSVSMLELALKARASMDRFDPARSIGSRSRILLDLMPIVRPLVPFQEFSHP